MKKITLYSYNLFLLVGMLFVLSCDASHLDENTVTGIKNATEKSAVAEEGDAQERKIETAIVGGGCFWCTEAQYLALEGVEKVISGYAGGHSKNPTYKEVCTGATGHAEVIKIEYDATVISFEEILQAFFIAHDPTQLNRQGADVGTQYRSTIMPLNDEQKKTAERIIKEFNDKEVFSHEVVTVVEKLDVFYPAEDYHQNYYANNMGKNPYCTRVVGPKLEKFKKVFKDKLKKN
jgi:methionine-S-sulfoxide reductase